MKHSVPESNFGSLCCLLLQRVTAARVFLFDENIVEKDIMKFRVYNFFLL